MRTPGPEIRWRWNLPRGLAAVVVCISPSVAHPEEAADAPKPIPASRPEINAALSALAERKPRLALPAENPGEPMLGYLPASWGGGGGLGGPGQINPRAAPDRAGRYPNPLEDALFTDASFWVVSRANNCHYCMGHQELKLRAGGLDDARMAALDRDWSAFNPRQQAALKFARELTLQPAATNDAAVASLSRHFTDPEIIELTFAIARFNAVNRWTDALGLPLESEGDGPAVANSAEQSTDNDAQTKSLVTPTRSAEPLPQVSAGEVAAAIEACRSRPPRVELPSETAAIGALAGVVRNRPPKLWERALAGLPIVGRTHVLVWNTVLTDNHLAPEFKAELAYITAVNNRAWYAAGTAAARLRELGVGDDKLSAFVADDYSGDGGAAAAYRLARKLTVEPQRITDADVAAVHRHFGDGETAQIIQVICLANLFDRFTEALGLPLDSQ
jgi:alkylhydroperoxidase family enzyme